MGCTIGGIGMGAKNPWLPEMAPPPIHARNHFVAPTGAIGLQPSVTPPEAAEQLKQFTTTTPSRVWVIGTHGGSAESTVAQLLGGLETCHRWPDTTAATTPATTPGTTQPPAVLLTARTHATGLRAAQLAMRAWAGGQTPHIRLIGLVLVADAPGKLPRPLSDLAEVISGGVPHLWHIGWVDQYRQAVDPTDPPRHVAKVLHEINTVLNAVTDTNQH